jgi:YVTN family beta-propeller protein
MRHTTFSATAFALSLLCFGCDSSSSEEDGATDEQGPATEWLIVLNKSDNTASIIDRNTGETLRSIATGLEPHEVAVSPDRRLAVIGNYGNREVPGNTLTVVSLPELEVVSVIDLGTHTRPHGIQWIRDSGHLIVTTEGSKHVLVVHVPSGETMQGWHTGQEVAHMVATTPDFRLAFVPNIGSDNVTVIDLEGDSVIRHIPTGKGAEGIAMSPDGREVWITNRSDDNISIINTETLEVVATLVCPAFPIRATFSPDGEQVLVSNARSGDVAVFNARGRSLIGRVSLQAAGVLEKDGERYFADRFEGSSIPIGLAVSPDGHYAYVANTNADVVSEIDLKTLEVTRHFKTGTQPDGIAFLRLD